MTSFRRLSTPLRRLTSTSMVLLGCLTLVRCWDGDSISPTAPPGPTTIVGSGNLSQQSRPVSGFDGVDLAGQGLLHLEHGVGEALLISAEDNLLPYLRSEVRGGILEIWTQQEVTLDPTLPIEYFVTASSLRSVQISGAGAIECSGLAADRLTLRASGVGSMEFASLDLRELEVMLDGVGNIRTSGLVDTQRITLGGVGDYRSRRLRSAEVHVELSGDGSATVRVSDRLVARVTGRGCVYYLGDPVVEATVTGSGCVAQID